MQHFFKDNRGLYIEWLSSNLKIYITFILGETLSMIVGSYCLPFLYTQIFLLTFSLIIKPQQLLLHFEKLSIKKQKD